MKSGRSAPLVLLLVSSTLMATADAGAVKIFGIPLFERASRPEAPDVIDPRYYAADLDVSGVFSVGGCGCGWRGILDVRNGVLDLFEAHEVKRVRFGNPWFDSLDAPQVVPLSELGSKTFDDLDQTLVDVRRVSGDPRPTRRLRDLADVVRATQ